MDDLRKLGEDGIIRLFDPGLFRHPVIRGIGDDCAVLDGGDGRAWLWTTDLLTEGIHFRRDTISAFDLGAKSLAVNLSDVAAMGGTPTAVLLSLALPADVDSSWLTAFRDGFFAQANDCACQVIGGDTCASAAGIFVSVTLIGVMQMADVIYRSGAHEGDDIWLSGIPGISAYGLALLSRGIDPEDACAASAIRAHHRPKPQLELGQMLAREHLTSACLDTSDGIARDLARLAAASGVGAVIEFAALPLPEISPSLPSDAYELALQGGEDYQLLFTAPRECRQRLATVADIHRIGFIDSDKTGVRVRRPDGTQLELKATGFNHFQENA